MRLLLLSPLCFVVGCATARAPARPHPPTEVLEFEPVVITAGPKEELDLAAYNDEELFALGTSAFAAKDFDKAARCFARLADVHSASPHRAGALFNAGLAYERLNRFADALERFKPIMDPAKGTGDALDASFRAAECYYHLDDYPPAIEILTAISQRDDIPFQEKLQAKVQRGVCHLEHKDLDAAERDLREALRWWGEKRHAESLDEYFPAQAQFFLGEIYRKFFELVDLDPAHGEAKLAKDLEYKCELLLSAQGHYLRAIRIGDGNWATASGFSIGALYEHMYDAMLNAKVPEGFDAEQTGIYREELRKKVRVLVTKAMAIYERTLAAAERIGVDNPFVQKTKQSLERMKGILVDERESAGGTTPEKRGEEPGAPSSVPAAHKPGSSAATAPREVVARR